MPRRGGGRRERGARRACHAAAATVHVHDRDAGAGRARGRAVRRPHPSEGHRPERKPGVCTPRRSFRPSSSTASPTGSSSGSTSSSCRRPPATRSPPPMTEVTGIKERLRYVLRGSGGMARRRRPVRGARRRRDGVGAGSQDSSPAPDRQAARRREPVGRVRALLRHVAEGHRAQSDPRRDVRNHALRSPRRSRGGYGSSFRIPPQARGRTRSARRAMRDRRSSSTSASSGGALGSTRV